MEELLKFDFESKGIDPIYQESKKEALAVKRSLRVKAKKEIRNDNFANIVNDCGLPGYDEMLLIKTNGASDCGSVFEYLNQEIISELYLSTWVISRENIDQLMKWFDSGAKKFVFVLSTRLRELKKSNYAYLIEKFNERKHLDFKLKVCNCHAKTFSVKTELSNFYSVTGSANWTENPRIENYIILNNKDNFDFNKEWMEDLVK